MGYSCFSVPYCLEKSYPTKPKTFLVGINLAPISMKIQSKHVIYNRWVLQGRVLLYKRSVKLWGPKVVKRVLVFPKQRHDPL